MAIRSDSAGPTAEPFGPACSEQLIPCPVAVASPSIWLLFVCANHLLVRARAVRFASNSPAFEVRPRIDEIVSLQPGGACGGMRQNRKSGHCSHGQLTGPLRQRFTWPMIYWLLLCANYLLVEARAVVSIQRYMDNLLAQMYVRPRLVAGFTN